MPAIQSDEAEALQQLRAICAPDTDPILNDAGDLQPILLKAKRASLWEAGKAYSFGDVVIPTEANRNGRRYRFVRTDGLGVSSAATEPAWPTSATGSVRDGNVSWQEDGFEYSSLWDMTLAAYLAWDLKVQKLTDAFDTGDDDEQYKFSQMIDNCRKQRDRFQPTVIA